METGEIARAEAMLSDAVDRARANGDRGLEAHVQIVSLLLKESTDPEHRSEEALETLGSVIPVLEELGDELGLARAYRLLGDVHFTRSSYAKADRALEQAIEHARKAGAEYEEAEAFACTRAQACYGPAPVTEVMSRCEKIMELAKGNPTAEAGAIRSMGALNAMQGRIDEGRELVRRAPEILEDHGLKMRATFVSEAVAFIETLAGDPAAAERALRAAYDDVDRLGDLGYQATAAALLAHAICAQGRFEEAEDFCRIAEEIGADDDLATQVLWRSAKAKVLAGPRRACRGRSPGTSSRRARRRDRRHEHVRGQPHGPRHGVVRSRRLRRADGRSPPCAEAVRAEGERRLRWRCRATRDGDAVRLRVTSASTASVNRPTDASASAMRTKSVATSRSSPFARCRSYASARIGNASSARSSSTRIDPRTPRVVASTDAFPTSRACRRFALVDLACALQVAGVVIGPAKAPRAPEHVVLVTHAREAARAALLEERSSAVPVAGLRRDVAEGVDVRRRSASVPQLAVDARAPPQPAPSPPSKSADHGGDRGEAAQCLRPGRGRSVAQGESRAEAPPALRRRARAPARTTRGHRHPEGAAPRPQSPRTGPARRGCCRAPPRSALIHAPGRRSVSRIRCGSASSASSRKCSAWRRRISSASPLASSRSSANSRIVSYIQYRSSVRRTRLFSTRDPSVSRSASATRSAASSVAPPAKTARRANRRCSAGSSRSCDHSIVERSVRWRGSASRPPVNRSRRWERRSRICAGARTFARAAASSIASGISSRARQSSWTASSASARPCAGDEELDRVRLGERLHLVLDLAADAEALPARREDREVRTGLDEVGERRRRLDHLLEVVEDEEHLALADVLGEAVLARRASSRSRRRRATGRGSARARPRTCPALWSPTSSAAASIESRVLPEPPGPVSVTRRAPSSRISATISPDLPFAADERARRPRQVRVRDRLQRREALGAELEDRDRPVEVLQAVLAEVERRPSLERPPTGASPRESSTWPPWPAAPILAPRWTSSPT